MTLIIVLGRFLNLTDAVQDCGELSHFVLLLWRQFLEVFNKKRVKDGKLFALVDITRPIKYGIGLLVIHTRLKERKEVVSKF